MKKSYFYVMTIIYETFYKRIFRKPIQKINTFTTQGEINSSDSLPEIFNTLYRFNVSKINAINKLNFGYDVNNSGIGVTNFNIWEIK